MSNQPTPSVPHGVVDPHLMKGVLAKAARSYGQILAGAGLLDALMASSWAWATRPLAIGLTVVGAIAIVAGLLVWGRNNVSTLRDLTTTSRTFLGGSLAIWLVGLVVALVVKQAVVWWVVAVALLALAGWCAWQAYRKADELTARPTPDATF